MWTWHTKTFANQFYYEGTGRYLTMSPVPAREDTIKRELVWNQVNQRCIACMYDIHIIAHQKRWHGWGEIVKPASKTPRTYRWHIVATMCHSESEFAADQSKSQPRTPTPTPTRERQPSSESALWFGGCSYVCASLWSMFNMCAVRHEITFIALNGE